MKGKCSFTIQSNVVLIVISKKYSEERFVEFSFDFS